LVTICFLVIYPGEYEKTIEDFNVSHSSYAQLSKLSGPGKWQGDTQAIPGPCQWKVEQGKNDHDHRPTNLDEGS
jgi:hypothetical protein